MDGKQLEIPREEALELLPYRHVFRSRQLKEPIAGVFCHRGKMIPVLGPLPEDTSGLSVDERPWILLMKSYAQAVRGLPEFLEAESVAASTTTDETSENTLMSELDEILKAA